jgi:methyl-accepting chemotaxis protein
MIMKLSLWSSLICGVAFFCLFSYFLNRIIQSLNAIMQSLSGSSHEVAEASTLIAHSSTELSNSVTEQASTMQEMVATIDEISAMVQRNTEATQDSLHMATTSQNLAREGGASIQQMVASFHDISQSHEAIAAAMTRSHDDIGRIITLIGEIGNQTRVINDIVLQTRLLSFNASVEAARAGDHGKGFAVVAEEVGQLAQMSGRAAREISANLEHTHHQVQDIVMRTRDTVHGLMENGKARVEAGTKVAGECGRVLSQITESFTAVHQKISEIATASREQNRGIQEVTRAIAQLDVASHQNATVAEQCSSASEQLHDESAALKTLVADLLRTVGTRSQTKPETNAHTQESEEKYEDVAFREAA